MTEEEPRKYGYQQRNDNSNDETDRVRFHAIDEVHSEETGNQSRQHEDDGHRGQCTHDGVHVVVDNTLVGIHRRLQDVRVDIRRLPCLCHLNRYVLDEVGIQFVNLQLELQLGKQGFIATDGCIEVGE